MKQMETHASWQKANPHPSWSTRGAYPAGSRAPESGYVFELRPPPAWLSVLECSCHGISCRQRSSAIRSNHKQAELLIAARISSEGSPASRWMLARHEMGSAGQSGYTVTAQMVKPFKPCHL